MGYMCLFQFWFTQDTCQGVGLLGLVVFLFLVFKGISILSSIVAISIYIPTKSNSLLLLRELFPSGSQSLALRNPLKGCTAWELLPIFKIWNWGEGTKGFLSSDVCLPLSLNSSPVNPDFFGPSCQNVNLELAPQGPRRQNPSGEDIA